MQDIVEEIISLEEAEKNLTEELINVKKTLFKIKIEEAKVRIKELCQDFDVVRFAIFTESEQIKKQQFYNLQLKESGGDSFSYCIGIHEFTDKEKIYRNDWAIDFADDKLRKELRNYLRYYDKPNVPLKRKGFNNEFTKDFYEYEHLVLATLFEIIRLRLNLNLKAIRKIV